MLFGENRILAQHWIVNLQMAHHVVDNLSKIVNNFMCDLEVDCLAAGQSCASRQTSVLQQRRVKLVHVR